MHNLKNKINMDIPKRLETTLRNRIKFITLFTGILAFSVLVFFIQFPLYFFTSIIIGFTAMAIDFLIEYLGITRNRWDYPAHHISFRRVPVEVPLLFFNCGVLSTFIFWHFSLIEEPVIFGFSLTQIILFLTGTFFLVQYFRGKVKTLIFGILPISIGFYLFYPKTWILALSILPVYIDYYLEKRLVKCDNITYNKYDENVAVNVAISYFPATVLIFSLIAVVLSLSGA